MKRFRREPGLPAEFSMVKQCPSLFPFFSQNNQYKKMAKLKKEQNGKGSWIMGFPFSESRIELKCGWRQLGI